MRVRDNGVGILKEEQTKIPQPFFTRKPTGKGNTGLGLSIRYEIITQGFQGTIEMESEEGHYAEFRISFPFSLSEG